MKAMNAARRGVRSGLGFALALLAVDASAQPAPSVESPKPTRNQTEEAPRERGGPAEKPAEAGPRESPELGEKPAGTDKRPSASAEHAEQPVSGQAAQAGPGQDGAREQRVPEGNANQLGVSNPPVVGEPVATGTVPDQGRTENDSPRTPWGIEVGVGPLVAWVPDDSFDLFSDSGYWPALAVRVSSSIWSNGPFDVAASGAYHYAETNGAARQAPTELVLHRFLVGGQARYHLLSWLAPYGRLLAGLSYLTSQLGSGDEDEAPTLKSFDFCALASAGVQARILEAKRIGLLVHLYVEGGGIFTSNTELVYQLGSGAPPRSQPVDAGTLSLTGPQLQSGVLALF